MKAPSLSLPRVPRAPRAALVALALSVGSVGAAALAQHEGAPVVVEPGFHQPPPMNVLHYPPPPITVEHEGHAVQEPGPPPFIGPLINFALLVLIGYMALKRSINPALNVRRVAMETEIAEARRLHTEAEAMHKEYTTRLAGLDAEVSALRAEFTRAGEAERDRIIAEARARAERMRTEGAQAVEAEFKSLREDLKREVVLAAVSAAEETVRKSITSADQDRLTEGYLTDLASGAVRPGASA